MPITHSRSRSTPPSATPLRKPLLIPTRLLKTAPSPPALRRPRQRLRSRRALTPLRHTRQTRLYIQPWLLCSDAKPITGSYGTLSLNADGSYTYFADQDAADALGSGDLATDIFTYTISDDTDNAKAELSITITGINDAPIIFDATTRRKYIEGSGQSMVIDTSLSGIDADHLTISSASVVISSGYFPSEDLLSLGDDAGGLITASWNPTNGTLTLTGTTTAENYERALESVAYENTNLINPSTTERTIAWSVNDGITNSMPPSPSST